MLWWFYRNFNFFAVPLLVPDLVGDFVKIHFVSFLTPFEEPNLHISSWTPATMPEEPAEHSWTIGGTYKQTKTPKMLWKQWKKAEFPLNVLFENFLNSELMQSFNCAKISKILWRFFCFEILLANFLNEFTYWCIFLWSFSITVNFDYSSSSILRFIDDVFF